LNLTFKNFKFLIFHPFSFQSLALSNFIKILPQNLPDRDVCSIVHSKLFAKNHLNSSTNSEIFKSHGKVNEIIFNKIAEVMEKLRNTQDKREIVSLLHKIENHENRQRAHAPSRNDRQGPSPKKLKSCNCTNSESTDESLSPSLV
jgi:hypothetical protein